MKQLIISIVLLIAPIVQQSAVPLIKSERTMCVNKRDVRREREMLKEFFVWVCVTEAFDVDGKDISGAVYVDLSNYDPKAYTLVREYAKDFVQSISPAPLWDYKGKKAIMFAIMGRYKSKELSDYIKTLDKYLFMW